MSKITASFKVDEKALKKLKKKAIDQDKQYSDCLEEAILMWVQNG